MFRIYLGILVLSYQTDFLNQTIYMYYIHKSKLRIVTLKRIVRYWINIQFPGDYFVDYDLQFITACKILVYISNSCCILRKRNFNQFEWQKYE